MKHSRQGGFSLIELTVVVGIIGVLTGLGAATFVASKNRASNRAAQVAAVQSVKAARTATEDGTYAAMTIADLSQTEPSITFVPGGTHSSGLNIVSVEIPTTRMMVLAVWSPAGTCFYLRDDLDGPTRYATIGGAPRLCRADSFTAIPASAWSSAW